MTKTLDHFRLRHGRRLRCHRRRPRPERVFQGRFLGLHLEFLVRLVVDLPLNDYRAAMNRIDLALADDGGEAELLASPHLFDPLFYAPNFCHTCGQHRGNHQPDQLETK